MKRSLLSVFAILSLLFANAQQFTAVLSKDAETEQKERCSTSQKMQELRNQDPAAYDLRQQQSEQEIQNWIDNNYETWKAQRAVITIPVVVQIWVNTSSVPDAAVYEQIQTLNEDFRRTNSDASNTPADFISVAADCEIEFCLASSDPQGNSTTGIVRHTTNDGGDNSYLWDTDKYLNLFVYNIGGGTLGFTYLASQAPNNAVHIGADYFGSTGASAPYNLGRTATHEVGHWLNLEHTWGNGGCSSDDNVNDTPMQDQPNYGCPSHPSASCSNGGDMFMNYMDYVNDNCMNTFTEDQKSRMISAINNYRSGLLTSAATACSGVSPTPDADFSANNTIINVGQTVDFTDQSTGIFGAWNYSWTFNGGTPSSSTSMNPSGIQYNTAGTYTVELTIDSSSVSDTETKTNYITVLDPSDTTCSLKDTVLFPLPGTVALYGTQGGGYLAGTNEYGDAAKANFIENNGTYKSVNAVALGFAAASGTSTIPVKVWADNSGSPGSELGSTSVSTVDAAAAASAGGYAIVSFPSNIDVIGSDFFIGFEIPTAAGDTAAVFTNSDGDTSPGIGWELWSDGTWYDMTTAWQGLNVALAVHPIVCIQATSIEENRLSDQVSIFPNPTTGVLTLYFGEKPLENANIIVRDVAGKVVSNEKCNANTTYLDLSEQSNGIYFIEVRSAHHNSVSKVQILK